MKQQIAEHGNEDACSYCTRHGRSFPLGTMADRVEKAFEQHYERTPLKPTAYESAMAEQSGFPWSRRGIPVVDAIARAAEVPSAVAIDIQGILESRDDKKQADSAGEEAEFGPESHYAEREVDGNHWREQWIEFERSIASQARFFGHHAQELLTAVFANMDDTGDFAVVDGRKPILDIGPAASLQFVYRARVLRSDEEFSDVLCRPDLHLGPPPGHLAPAGRMNARGISVFYGATDAETAIAEVRPPVGSKVAVARFEVIRPLRVLSLEHLGVADAVGSIFDESYAGLRQRAAFLRSLCGLLCEPVAFADDDLDYLPTQAVADFLATENDPRLDGIAYPSTQIELGSALNLVVFHRAARVEELEVPEDAVIEVMTAVDEEGSETGFQVFEFATPEPWDEVSSHRGAEGPASSGGNDIRQPTLRIDLDSLSVHEVAGVQTSTYRYSVSRARWPSPPPRYGVPLGVRGAD